MEEEQDASLEDDDQVDMLRQQIQLLSTQFYRDRSAWLEEKRQLLAAQTQQNRQPEAPGARTALRQATHSYGGAASSVASSTAMSSIDDSARLEDSFSSAQAWATAQRLRSSAHQPAGPSPSPSMQAVHVGSNGGAHGHAGSVSAGTGPGSSASGDTTLHELEAARAALRELQAKCVPSSFPPSLHARMHGDGLVRPLCVKHHPKSLK